MDVNQIIQGDALSVLKSLPDGIVQTCVTSPPYYGLRDYQTETILQLEGDPQDCQHVWIHEGRNEDGAKVAQCQHCFAAKVDRQIGLEETPDAYVAKLVEVFHEVKRVLRDDGTLWVNIGDSYVGGNYRGGGAENASIKQRSNAGTLDFMATKLLIPSGYKPKDLYGIPWMLAFALRADGWYLRSDCIWNKPTAMPESVTDRPTKAHEYLFLLAKSERYYYDCDAIREPLKPKTFTTYGTKHHAQGNDPLGKVKSDNWGRTVEERQPRVSADGSLAGANKRTVWTVASQPFSEAHFATFPPKLIEPCILAGTSPRACEHCGSSWERVTETTGGTWEERKTAGVPMRYGLNSSKGTPVNTMGTIQTYTTGWQPTCSCANEGTGKCIILDPFIGAGTTALVAIQHGRNYLGIDLNVSYVQLAEKRIATVQQNLWTSGSEAIAV